MLVAMRAVVMSLLAAVSVVVVALPRDAAADCRDRISLSPPSDGESVDAIGRAEIRSNDSGARQTFTVEVDVDVPEGTPLFVFANGEPAGMITFAPGIATLELSNADGVRLPSGVDPVCSIGPVAVTDADGTTLLTGSF
jgi:hypothetical protein